MRNPVTAESLRTTHAIVRASQNPNHYLRFFDRDNFLELREILVILEQNQKIKSSFEGVQADADVHTLSPHAKNIFELAMRIFQNTEMVNVYKVYAKRVCNEIETRASDIRCLPTLKQCVVNETTVCEGAMPMGRMDQLVGLIGVLCEEDLGKMASVLKENDLMGGGCPQGIFTRFAVYILAPKMDEMIQQIQSVVTATPNF